MEAFANTAGSLEAPLSPPEKAAAVLLAMGKPVAGKLLKFFEHDELQTIIKGKLRIVESNGTEHHFVPGDSFFTYKGERLVCDVVEPVEKIFFTYNPLTRAICHYRNSRTCCLRIKHPRNR